MPIVLGYIDGTLVKIVPPPRRLNGEVYVCRKGYAALNVQIVSNITLCCVSCTAFSMMYQKSQIHARRKK